MRIKTIRLSWFRGAADSAELEPLGKGMVLYGGNGSGKSSFVDAIEFAITGGKIRHLSHEYSGKHLLKAVPNTHRPDGAATKAAIEFQNGQVVKIETSVDGPPKFGGDAVDQIRSWEYRRTVLRQDELAQFVHATKGEKYSTLLPLLGLHDMEVAAENLRQLAKEIATEAKPWEIKARLKAIQDQKASLFGTQTDGQVASLIQSLHGKYCPEKLDVQVPLKQCHEVRVEIEARSAKLTPDHQRHLALRTAGAVDLADLVGRVRKANLTLADSTEPFVSERLAILDSATELAGKVHEADLNCPACGRVVSATDFKAHVDQERARLQEFRAAFDERNVVRGLLSDAIKTLRSTLLKEELETWRQGLRLGALAGSLSLLNDYDAEVLRASCGELELTSIVDCFIPLGAAAAAAAGPVPIDLDQLFADRRTCDVASAVFEGLALRSRLAQVEGLIRLVGILEAAVRAGIRAEANSVVGQITEDIQTFWSVLHPGVSIQDVRLFIPDGADKAIDITLKFYEKELASPRLTLSEGYRNSLGLCIFLAMAKREAASDRPIVLDDVIVSLDRDHRGMVADLLRDHFKGRQVIVLTHDRDWAAELRHRLDNAEWKFETLLPYETPNVGIRLSDKKTTFAEALAVVDIRPDSAANDARKIMDIEMATIAEKLQVRLPYVRGVQNDYRTAHEFLVRISSDAEACFQKKEGEQYLPFPEAIASLKAADVLLVTWGNKGSHTFDTEKAEAKKLIESCQAALEVFTCSHCKKRLWFAEADGPKVVQCQCGAVRWRYGKG